MTYEEFKNLITLEQFKTDTINYKEIVDKINNLKESTYKDYLYKYIEEMSILCKTQLTYLNFKQYMNISIEDRCILLANFLSMIDDKTLLEFLKFSFYIFRYVTVNKKVLLTLNSKYNKTNEFTDLQIHRVAFLLYPEFVKPKNLIDNIIFSFSDNIKNPINIIKWYKHQFLFAIIGQVGKMQTGKKSLEKLFILINYKDDKLYKELFNHLKKNLILYDMQKFGPIFLEISLKKK